MPERVAQALVALQPPPAGGVRLTQREDLHLTLHFLGDVPVEPVRQILQGLAAPEFPVTLVAPGSFSLAGGRRILWIGADPTQPLLDLHRRVGAQLARLGFKRERRPYQPHITLARLTARAPASVTQRFVEQSLSDADRHFDCASFVLYASRSNPTGPRYRLVQGFALDR